MAALLAIRVLPHGENPIRFIVFLLFPYGFDAEDGVLQPQFHRLMHEDFLVLFVFARTLMDQLIDVKTTKEQR